MNPTPHTLDSTLPASVSPTLDWNAPCSVERHKYSIPDAPLYFVLDRDSHGLAVVFGSTDEQAEYRAAHIAVLIDRHAALEVKRGR